MIRVLHVVNSMNCGGTENLIMNLFRAIDRTEFMFDFVVHDENKGFFDDEIKDLGGLIYYAKRFNGVNFREYSSWWKDHFEKHPEHTIVHGHLGSSAAIYLKLAKKYGRYAIAHSHSTKNKSIRGVIWSAYSFPTRFVADSFLACSNEAGIDRYGKRIAGSGNYHIIHNAIDTHKFAFSEEEGMSIRARYQIGDRLVIGHVGRFSEEKNHRLLLEIFSTYNKENNNSVLLLVGDGPLRKECETIVKENNLESSVIFAGVQKDIARYYSAMNVFCFPSIYEGLGMVAVEAQTNGLPVIASDRVPALADIGAGLFERISIDDNIEQWVKEINKCIGKRKRVSLSKYSDNSGYDIVTVTRELQNIYRESLNVI